METNNKLRKALEYVRGMVGLFRKEERISYDEWQGCDDMISDALAEPVRNCEVGTVTDQRKRYARMCQYNCDKCALQEDRALKGGCEFSWAQMPYEEGVAE